MAIATFEEIENEYDDLRDAYVKKFDEDPPEYMPIEFEGAIDEMKSAIKTGIALDDIPEDAVT